MSNQEVDWTNKPNSVKLVGNECFFKDRHLQSAISLLSDLHIEQYVGGEEDDDAIEQALLSPSSPFFETKKLLIIEQADRVECREAVEHYCSEIDDDKVVIFVSTRSGRDLKWFKQLETEYEIECDSVSDWNTAKWLTQEAAERGYSMSKNIAEAIVLNVGTDLYKLDGELDKIELFVGDETYKIQTNDVLPVLFDDSAISPFEIIRHWALRNRKTALQFFVRHFNKTPDTQWTRSELILINGFLNRVENLMKAKSMQISGSNDAEIAEELDKSVWFYRKKIKDQTLPRDLMELRSAYHQLTDIEYRIKKGESGYLLLQNFVIQQ